MVGWGPYPRFLGVIGIGMLVLLRLTIGWHFFSEGVDKKTEDWSAAPFFASARGPFADEFQRLVPDRRGLARLDIEVTKKQLAGFRNIAINHYGFGPEQKEEAQEAYVDAVKQVQYVLDTNANEIEEYRLGLGRVQKLRQDRVRADVSSLRGQREAVEAEWKSLVKPALVNIDVIWKVYEETINSIASEGQRSSGYLKLYLPAEPGVDPQQIELIDRFIPYFDMTIGICLMVGLFTPMVSLVAAAFLFSVFLSQFPPATGPFSTNYQLIESMGCLVLAGTAAGRFAGLDFILHALIRRCWSSKEKTNG